MATFRIAFAQHRDEPKAEDFVRQLGNHLEYQHNFYCRLYQEFVKEIAKLNENWNNGVYWSQRIECESENSKGN